MLPCLRITLSLTVATPRQHHRSSARKFLGALHALRRTSTTVISPPYQQQNDQNNPQIDDSGLEFLCTLGMDTASATALLKKVPTPLSASRLNDLCFVLTSIANVPVAKLAELFFNADPELFTLSTETISANYKAICGAWPSERQLRDSIISYPAILSSSFPGELRRCMTSLRDMGFSTSQTAAAVVRCSELTKLRRYEITSTLAQCGMSLSKTKDPEIFEMLSKNPNFLTPVGNKNLSTILEAVKKATGLTSQQAQHIVARCPNTIFQQDRKDIRRIADLLMEFGLTQAQVGQAALLWPHLLSRKLDRVQQTLAILSAYLVTPTQITGYPQVFTHNPERILAPRLAFLRRTAPEKISMLSLASIFSSTDEAFSSTYSKNASTTYLKYKLKALVMNQMDIAAALGVSTAAAAASSEEDDNQDAEEIDGNGDQDKKNKILSVSKSRSDDDAKARNDKSVPHPSSQQKGAQQHQQHQKQSTSTGAQLKEGQKQEEASSAENNTTEKRKQQQQQQRRRFFKRTNGAATFKQQNKKQQPQQQQLKRLTPEQIEKSKEKKK